MAANFKMTLTMLFAASSYPLRHDVQSESSDDEADFKTWTLTRADWVAHSINMSEPPTLTKRPIIPFKTGIMGKKVSRGRPRDPEDSEYIKFVPIRPAQFAAIKDI